MPQNPLKSSIQPILGGFVLLAKRKQKSVTTPDFIDIISLQTANRRFYGN